MRFHRTSDETLQRLPSRLGDVLRLSEQGTENTFSRHFADTFCCPSLAMPGQVELL